MRGLQLRWFQKGAQYCGGSGRADSAISVDSVTGAELALIVNTAKAAWAILEKNRPVYNQETDFARAVPHGVPFEKLCCFRRIPKTHRFRIEHKVLGGHLVDLELEVFFKYRGRHKGRGRFIDNATILVRKRFINMGQVVNLHARADNATNVGSAADPVAALDLFADFDRRTMFLPHHGLTKSFHIFGDGKVVPSE